MPLLTAKDVARYLQVSVRTIRRWVRKGLFPAPLQIGGALRFQLYAYEYYTIEGVAAQMAKEGRQYRVWSLNGGPRM